MLTLFKTQWNKHKIIFYILEMTYVNMLNAKTLIIAGVAKLLINRQVSDPTFSSRCYDMLKKRNTHA